MASLNWAMTGPSGAPLALPAEKFLMDATSVTISLFPSQPGAPLTQAPEAGTEYVVAGGTVYLSNKRIVYVAPQDGAKGTKPASKDQPIKTFSVPLERALDGRLHQPWFGAPYYEALAMSAQEGGLQGAHVVRFYFKERGAGEFAATVAELQARLGTDSGRATPVEPLPLYSPPPGDPALSPDPGVAARPGPSGLANEVRRASPSEGDMEAARVARTAEADERAREFRSGEVADPPAHDQGAPPGYEL